MRWHWRDRQSNEAHVLDAYWDEVVRAAPAMPMPQPDESPELARIVRHLHAAEEADRSRPAYENRLLQRLLALQESTATDTTLGIEPPLPSAPIRRDTRARPATTIRAEDRRQALRGRRVRGCCCSWC